MTIKMMLERLDNKMDRHGDRLDKLDVKVGKIEEHLKGMNGKVQKHDEDIEKNKEFRFFAIGGAVVVSTVITIVLKYLAVI